MCVQYSENSMRHSRDYEWAVIFRGGLRYEFYRTIKCNALWFMNFTYCITDIST
jgi:hypothetical protein